MGRVLSFALSLPLLGVAVFAQPYPVSVTFNNPSGLACQSGQATLYAAATTVMFTCQSGVFVQVTGGGGSIAPFTTDGTNVTLPAGTLTVVDTVLGPHQQIDVNCTGNVTATLQAAIDTLQAANGGTIRLSSGSCYSTAQIVNTSTSGYVTAKRITGASASPNGTSQAPHGGTQLDLQYASAAKVYTTGYGSLEIDHITFLDTVDGTQAFAQTGNTNLYVHDNAFYGKTATVTTQNGIILGDRSTGSVPTPTMFQGYGTVITSNFFTNLQIGVYLQKFANAVTVTNNVGWNIWGTSTTGFIQCDGIDTSDTGLTATGNLVEMNHMIYGVYFAALCGRSTLINNFYDGTGSTLGQYYFSADSLNNTVITEEGQGFPVVAGPGAAGNLIIDAYQNGTNIPEQAAFGAAITTKGITAAGPISTTGTNTISVPSGQVIGVGNSSGVYSTPGGLFLRANNHDNFEITSSGDTFILNAATFNAGGFLNLSSSTGRGLQFIGTAGQHIATKQAGNDIAGTCTFSGTACTVTFTTGYAAAPACTATDQTAAAPLQVTPGTTTLVITGGTGAGATDVVAYHCIGNPS